MDGWSGSEGDGRENRVNEQERKLDFATLSTGIILTAFGVLFLLDRMDVADFGDIVRNYWPCLLIASGIPQLFRRDKVWSGLWLITLGLWMQIANLRLFGMTLRNSWPLLLIVAGAGMIMRSLIEGFAGGRRDEQR